MKKMGLSIFKVSLLVFLLFLIVYSIVLTKAQDTGSDKIDKAKSCAIDKIGTCSLSVEEQAFSLLAFSSNSEIESKCKDALLSQGRECWPSGNCNLKDTALAILALDRAGESTSQAENWLLEQVTISSDINWYLEIDTTSASTCKVSYSGTDYAINVGDDKKLAGSTGNCLSLAQDNYWLRISDSCLDTSFTVSCDQDFLSTILYKKAGSNIIHVSSQTKSASASGSIEQRIDKAVKCFQQGNTCDYEGSLWATLALKRVGKNVDEFSSYLSTESSENKQYFPAAFLYTITGNQEFFTSLANSQSSTGYWQISSYGKFYDTALALLAVSDTQLGKNAKDYLLTSQSSDGCWQNSLRDTAFILYAGWPSRVTPIQVDGGVEYCEDSSFFCMPLPDCNKADGNILDDYYCSGFNVCCDKEKREKTCEEMGGKECGEGKKCSANTLTTSDSTKCCLADCKEEEIIITMTQCEEKDYDCKTECSEDEEQTGDECEAGEVCCRKKDCELEGLECRFECEEGEEEYGLYCDSGICCGEKGKSYWYIYLLVFLILLTIIGIIFRDKLRGFILKIKTKGKKGPPSPLGPPGFGRPPRFPPGQPGVRPRMVPRQAFTKLGQQRQPAIPRRATTRTDKELEETLEKLKKMSKSK